MNFDRTQIRPGMTVRDTEGQKLGTIAQVGERDFIIEKGWLFKEDYRALGDRITDIRGDEVIYRRLGAQPGTVEGAALPGDAFRRGEAVPAAPGETLERPQMGVQEVASRPEAELPRSEPARGEELRIPLAEEQLVVDKETRLGETAHLHKEVVTEEREVTVPVKRERIVVEHEPLSKPRAADEAAFRGQDIEVQAMEEEVHVSKQPVVREEVRVRKEPIVEQRAASEELRREELRVDEDEMERRARREEREGGMRAPGRDDDKKL